MNTLGFRYALLMCSGMMVLNILSGIFFVKKSFPVSGEQDLKGCEEARKNKITLKIKGQLVSVMLEFNSAVSLYL